MKRSVVLAAGLMAVAACRGDDEPDPMNPDSGVGPSPDMGVVVTGDCPTGAGDALTVCELKLDGNPRQPALGDPIEVANVVVTTGAISLTQTATSGLNGFYVQDQATTPELNRRYSGIVVTYFADEMMNPPAPGDVLSIVGNFRDFGQDGADRQKQIQLISFTSGGSGMIEPVMIGDPSTIATNGADARAYEGALVEVRDVEALQVRDVPGAGGSSIFGAFTVTGDLVVRNSFTNIQADMGERFNRIAGVLRVGTAPFDAGIYALSPRDASDFESATMAIRDIVTLQDPSADGRPSICTQRGGNDTRMGVCPRVSFSDVVISATDPVDSGRVSLWVQDTSVSDGRFSGVRVFNARVEGDGTPSVGDRVNLSGVAVLFFDGLQIADGTLTLTGEPGSIDPVMVAPADIPGAPGINGGEVTNPYEGVLVQIQNVDVTNACIDSSGDRGYFEVAGGTIIGGEFNYSYNGGFAEDAACGDMSRPGDMRQVGDTFQSITGVMDYTFSQFRLNPRSDADLVQ